jgi:hypothetical protein
LQPLEVQNQRCWEEKSEYLIDYRFEGRIENSFGN